MSDGLQGDCIAQLADKCCPSVDGGNPQHALYDLILAEACMPALKAKKDLGSSIRNVIIAVLNLVLCENDAQPGSLSYLGA